VSADKGKELKQLGGKKKGKRKKKKQDDLSPEKSSADPSRKRNLLRHVTYVMKTIG